MAPKSDPQIGVSVDTGDRLVGAGCKDADGKYDVPLVDNDGHLQVDILSGGGGGTQYTEDVAAATDPIGTALNLIRQDSITGLTTTDGDNVALRGSNYGAAYVQVITSGGGTVDTFGGTQYTEGDVDTSITGTAAMMEVASNTLQPIQGTVADGLLVNLGANNDVTAVGTIADDSTTPGAPVMIGGSAVETDGTDPTSVSAEADVARVRTDRNRRLLVNTFHPNLWSANENHSSAQTNNALKAAPGSNLSLYITDVIISNGATAGSVQIVTDTGGTPATILGPYYLAINGGMSKRFATPIRLAADKDAGFTSTTVTTHSVTLSGFIAP